MKKNRIIISNDLKNDLKKYASNVGIGIACRIRDDMYEEAQKVINLFYSSYSPVKYHRHEYNFKKKSFEKYYYNPHNQIIKGGIKLTPYELDNIYKSNYGNKSVVKYENSEKIPGVNVESPSNFGVSYL